MCLFGVSVLVETNFSLKIGLRCPKNTRHKHPALSIIAAEYDIDATKIILVLVQKKLGYTHTSWSFVILTLHHRQKKLSPQSQKMRWALRRSKNARKRVKRATIMGETTVPTHTAIIVDLRLRLVQACCLPSILDDLLRVVYNCLPHTQSTKTLRIIRHIILYYSPP